MKILSQIVAFSHTNREALLQIIGAIMLLNGFAGFISVFALVIMWQFIELQWYHFLVVIVLSDVLVFGSTIIGYKTGGVGNDSR